MTVLITGPDGVLGHNLAIALLDNNYSVKVLIQTGKETPVLDKLNVEKFYGDILNRDDVTKAMAGCDYVIHAAALTDTWPCRHKSYWRVNVEGTKVMIDVAKKEGIKRFIHVGTANSFGYGSIENPGNEEKEYCADKLGLDYICSKYRAHLLVLDEVKKGFNAVIVNPTFMIGPYDSKPSSGAMILALNSGVPGYPSGGRNFVYVNDVVAAIVNAITIGKTGESYILAGHNLHYKDIFAKMAFALGVKAPKTKMPDFLTIAYGGLMSLSARLFSFTPKVNYRISVISTKEHFYTANKAIRELKMPQTPIENALEEAVAWFSDNGYL